MDELATKVALLEQRVATLENVAKRRDEFVGKIYLFVAGGLISAVMMFALNGNLMP